MATKGYKVGLQFRDTGYARKVPQHCKPMKLATPLTAKCLTDPRTKRQSNLTPFRFIFRIL